MAETAIASRGASYVEVGGGGDAQTNTRQKRTQSRLFTLFPFRLFLSCLFLQENPAATRRATRAHTSAAPGYILGGVRLGECELAEDGVGCSIHTYIRTHARARHTGTGPEDAATCTSRFRFLSPASPPLCNTVFTLHVLDCPCMTAPQDGGPSPVSSGRGILTPQAI